MKKLTYLAALALAVGACGQNVTAAAPKSPEQPRYDGGAECVEVAGGHTLGGGNYAPGPCPNP